MICLWKKLIFFNKTNKTVLVRQEKKRKENKGDFGLPSETNLRQTGSLSRTKKLALLHYWR